MKINIFRESNTTDNEIEVLACARYYARVALLVKRSFEDGEFRRLVHCVFFMTEAQAQEIMNSSKTGEPFGVMVGRRYRGYTNYLCSRLRANFDCLLLMFWKDKNTKPIVDAQIGLWKANQVLTAASRSTRTVNDSVPIISDEDINDFFLKNNYHLVSDIWSPILDVLPVDFLIMNNEWGKKFLKSTCIILSWYITYHFRLQDPLSMIEQGLGSGIETTLKTSAIAKGDLPFTGFPELRKPEGKWSKKMNWPWYGQLVGSRTLQDHLEEEIEGEVLLECGSKTEMSAEDEELPSVFDTVLLEDRARLMADALKKRTEALIRLQRIAEEKNIRLLSELNQQELWLNNSRSQTERLVRQKEVGWVLEKFMQDVKKQFSMAESREQEANVLNRDLAPEQASPEDVIGSFVTWMEFIKEKAWFKELVVQYQRQIRGGNFQQGVSPYGMMQAASYGMPLGGQQGMQNNVQWQMAHQGMQPQGLMQGMPQGMQSQAGVPRSMQQFSGMPQSMQQFSGMPQSMQAHVQFQGSPQPMQQFQGQGLQQGQPEAEGVMYRQVEGQFGVRQARQESPKRTGARGMSSESGAEGDTGVGSMGSVGSVGSGSTMESGNVSNRESVETEK